MDLHEPALSCTRSPASVLALVAGVALAIDGPWSIGDLWIIVGLVGFAASGAMVRPFTRHEVKAIELAGRARGMGPQATGRPRTTWR